ncbi:MAG: type I restriction enzyme HsdR N-terminal domain-containing protein [Parachlamydiales bacterium]|nr:type I restriction enzyme HsdR N-terminal domain-containing protein [Parachlamydiales bacterium]
MTELFDPIREMWVPDLPEERVRQKLLHHMIQDLQYPQSYIAVEKEIALLPHLSGKKSHHLKRRVDIICFGKDIHPQHLLYPLLLVECKATPLSGEVIEQVLGYNYTVGAYFVAVANEGQIQVMWQDLENRVQKVDFLPSYPQMIRALQKDQ